MVEEKISIYELLLINRTSSSSSDTGKILDILGFDPNLKENTKSKELQAKCRELGSSGWVICPFWEVNLTTGETIPDTWYEKLNSNSTDTIKEYFKSNNYYLLINIIARSRFNIPSRFYNWINEAEKLFFEKRYIPCAMMLTAILEGSIRECPINIWKRQITKFYDEAVTKKNL